jgi:hypothetical protein
MSTGACAYFVRFQAKYAWIFYDKRHDNINNTIEDILFKNIISKRQIRASKRITAQKVFCVTLTAYTVFIRQTSDDSVAVIKPQLYDSIW